MPAHKDTTTAVRARYGRLAPVYERANLERPLYAEARARAIELLELPAGAKVLDVACGTGVNFALLEQRIGPSGRLVGVDLTPQMLGRARARVARRGWQNVQLYESDVSGLSTARLEALGALGPDERFDAALCTLGLSVIPEWERAWAAMLAVVRPGGKVAVMDAGFPADAGADGELVAARPFARFLGRVFAAACSRRPWELVERDTDDATVERFTWGYVAAAAGRVRSSRGARGAALHATATAQISELIGLLSTRGTSALMLPCPGRRKLADATVGATAAHTAGSYERIAAFLRATVDGQAGHPPGGHDGEHRAEKVDLDDLLERLSAAQDALALLAELSDEQLDGVPAASEMKFCDGRRTLEQILSSLFKHQRHGVDAVKAAVA
jgi:demethylmenaquinone methyltransferase/2-methoxy-6-polyprenyl-1,4-benzoquinol methylase